MLELDRHLSQSLEQARHAPVNVQRYGQPWVWMLSSNAWADAARWSALDASGHPLMLLRQALDARLRACNACTTIFAITRCIGSSSASTMAWPGRPCSACACCRRAPRHCCSAAWTTRLRVFRRRCWTLPTWPMHAAWVIGCRNSGFPQDVYRTDTCAADHGAAVSSRMMRADQWQRRWVVAGLGSRASA